MALLDNSTVYTLYKPLRNALRKLAVGDSLLVLWNYAQNYAFERKIDCTSHYLTAFGSKNKIKKAQVFSEWEIESLTREVIVNAVAVSTEGGESLKNAYYLRRCIGKLKQLDNTIALHSSKASSIGELRRMMHRQFPWQSNALPRNLFLRYSKIFEYPQLNRIFESHFGLSRETFFTVAMAFISCYLNSPAVDDPPLVIGPDLPKTLTPQVLERFLDVFSLPLPELRQKLIHEQKFSEDYSYGFCSLRAFPMIRMDWLGAPSYVCPLPVLLIWAVTQGIYYHLVSRKGFDQALGDGFQAYVGEVLGQTTVHGRHYQLIQEEEIVAGHQKLRTVDWILVEPAAALFVECKAKRLTYEAKLSLATPDSLNTELDKIAEAVVQVYKTIEQYRQNKYSSFPYVESRAIHPIVVTMEDWYIIDPIAKEYIDQQVRKGLDASKISLDVLAQMPYTICSVQELELLSQVLQAISIEEVMGGWSDHPDQQLFHGSYLYDSFAERCSNTTRLFSNDFKLLFPQYLEGFKGAQCPFQR